MVRKVDVTQMKEDIIMKSQSQSSGELEVQTTTAGPGTLATGTTTTSPSQQQEEEETQPTTTRRGREAAPPASSRGRVRDHAPSTHRSRSRSALRKPKSVKRMLKSGWNSVRKNLSSQRSNASAASNDVVSRASTTDSVALSESAGIGKQPLETILTTTAGTGVAATATGLVSTLDDDASALELVVLLMDPISRRFELLQLEFDSARAKVSDLLTQIPLSVTETSLQTQEYSGVLDSTGNVQEGSVRLMEAFGYTSRNDNNNINNNNKMVLVAKPKGISSKECMRLAKPILSDTQVAKMVRQFVFHVRAHNSLVVVD
jgi:hypothetical protein